MLINTFFSLVPFLASVAKADYPVAPADQGCVDYGLYPQITVVNVVKTRTVTFPVVINTFIQQNTALNFLGGVTIVVNNAPTQILTIATGTSTATDSVATTIFPGNVNVFNTINIINFPVVISTFIQQNTIIQGAGGVNIVINNAPTFVFTTATGTSTVTATVTSTVTTGNTAPTSFILSPVAAAGPARRQLSAPQYVSPDGTTVARCSDAQVFSLDNGRLSSGGAFLSVGEGVASAPFVTAQAINAISTTFTASETLEWTNTAFSGARARFCLQAGRVNALFTANATLVGCAPQRLFVIPAAACVDGSIVSSSSSSSATSTPTGSSSSSGTASGSPTVTPVDSTTTPLPSSTSDVASSTSSVSSSSSSADVTSIPSSSTSSDATSSTITPAPSSEIPSSTSSSVATSSSTSTGPARSFPSCTGPPFGFDAVDGGGGCLPGCFCDNRVDAGPGSTIGFCENNTVCGTPCTTSADCSDTAECTSSFVDVCGSNTCLDFTACAGDGGVPTKRMVMRGGMRPKEIVRRF